MVSFGIALFVFLMQYLWVYIDEIIGKGAGIILIIELIVYLSVSLMPTALPVAVLIASVMTMGTLAEHYELSSMKSAGVPLLRVMMPLMLASLFISAFSFTCSNYLIPVANLKARTRLYDIRKQKPSLSLEEGAFNDDFQGFAIRIGKKGDDGKSLENVMLYKQGTNLRGRIEAVSARSGTMDVTPDERYFVLELEDGYQYQEPEPETKNNGRTFPFVRTKFDQYRKSFDLSEFEIEQTDESAFQDHQTMLSVSQLGVAIDSIKRAREQRIKRLSIEIGRYIAPLQENDRFVSDSMDVVRKDSIQLAKDIAFAKAADEGKDEVKKPVKPAPAVKDIGKTIEKAKQRAENDAIRSKNLAAKASQKPTMRDSLDKYAGNYIEYIRKKPNFKKTVYIDRGLQQIRSIRSYADGASRRLDAQRGSLVRHIYEQHAKWSFAFACFIFLFIGAPMGAIIRKGGFGYPILVSIIFFMVFVVLNIMCKKLMGSYTLQPALAAWIPIIVIFPVGALLTYSAMNDIKFSIAEQLGQSKAWQWIVKRFKKGKEL